MQSKNLEFIKISQLLSYFLLLLGGIFVFLFRSQTEISMPLNAIILFSILLLPIFERVLDMIFPPEVIQNTKKYKQNIIGGSILFGLSILVLMSGYENNEILIFMSVLIAIYFSWDERIYFCIALILLLYIVFFLLLQSQTLAEIVSVYLYYFLLAGLGVSLGKELPFFKHKKRKEIPLKIKKVHSIFFEKHTSYIVYGFYIFLFFITLFSLLYSTKYLLLGTFLIFFIVYLFSKTQGFVLEKHIQKSSFKDIWMLLLFFLSFLLFFIMITAFYNTFSGGVEQKIAYYILCSGFYIIGGIFIFFDWSWIFKKRLSFYSIFSIVLIISLVSLLFYKNVYQSNDMGENLETISLK